MFRSLPLTLVDLVEGSLTSLPSRRVFRGSLVFEPVLSGSDRKGAIRWLHFQWRLIILSRLLTHTLSLSLSLPLSLSLSLSLLDRSAISFAGSDRFR